MRISIAKISAGVLAAAFCLGLTAPARAIYTGNDEIPPSSNEEVDPIHGPWANDEGEYVVTAPFAYRSAAEQLGVTAEGQDKKIAAPKPTRVVSPGRVQQKDVFTGIKACQALDRNFIMRPATEDALKMLAPCMKGVSKLYGNNVYAEATIMNPDNIQIVVLDSVAGKTIVEDLSDAINNRGGGLFGHMVTLSVMDVSYKAPIKLLSDAEIKRMLDRHQKDYEAIQKKAAVTKKELRRLEQLLGY